MVDASQGVEAQTLANAHLAVDAGLEIIPVLNKIDLPGAEPEKAKEQIESVIGIDASDAILASAKQGIGIDEILEAIVTRMPAARRATRTGRCAALVFDSWFDQYRGVVILVHVVDGALEPRDEGAAHGLGRHVRGGAGRRLHAQADAGRRRCPRARSASWWPASRRCRTSPSATR